MKKLPTAYAWLANESGPRMLVEALKLYGTTEKAGSANNPVILHWAEELGMKDYTADSIPWCGLFIAKVAHEAGKDVAQGALMARSWLRWGAESKTPALGDVLVFWRGSRRGISGHVGLYVGEDAQAYHVLGGNQGDAVSIVRISKSRLLGARRQYRVGPPANVRRVRLMANGGLSGNEA